MFFWLQNMKWESRVFIRDELLTREQRLSSWWNHQLRAKSCGLLAWREVRRTLGFRIGWVRNKSYDIFTYIIIIFHIYRGRKIQKNFVLFSCEKLQESFHSVLYYCISICAGAESSPPLSETSAAFLTHCIGRKSRTSMFLFQLNLLYFVFSKEWKKVILWLYYLWLHVAI